MRLIWFSKRLGLALDSFGKPGHKREIFAAKVLVEASEFVGLKTGKHYDEHLADLFQWIGKRPLKRDLSGDAIRKKREYLAKCYPNLYRMVLKRMRIYLAESVHRGSS